MTEPYPPHLAEALSRLRAAADAAVEQGRRAAEDARAAGAAFERECRADLARHRRHQPDQQDEPDQPTGPPTPPARPRRRPPDDDDFSQFRIMRPLL